MAASSLRPIRRSRISSFPASVSKRQPPASFTSGTGNGQSSLPITSTRASGLFSSRRQRSAMAAAKISRLRRAVATSDESTSVRPSGPKIAITSSRLPALAASMRARTASSGVANVRWAGAFEQAREATRRSRRGGDARGVRSSDVRRVTCVASPLPAARPAAAAARAAAAFLPALFRGALRLAARVSRKGVGLRAAPLFAGRRRRIAAVPARFLRGAGRARRRLGLPIGALLGGALRAALGAALGPLLLALLLPVRSRVLRVLRAIAALVIMSSRWSCQSSRVSRLSCPVVPPRRWQM